MKFRRKWSIGGTHVFRNCSTSQIPVRADLVFCFLAGLVVVVVVDARRRLLLLTLMVCVDVDERVLGPARALSSSSYNYDVRISYFFFACG